MSVIHPQMVYQIHFYILDRDSEKNKKNAAVDQGSNQTARVKNTVYWLLYLANSDLDPDLDLGILL